MSILRRCIAVVLWLVGWVCGVIGLQAVLLLFRLSEWPSGANPFAVAGGFVATGLLFLLGGAGAVFAGQWLWRGDLTQRWSPPRLARNFYLYGCALILVILFLK